MRVKYPARPPRWKRWLVDAAWIFVYYAWLIPVPFVPERLQLFIAMVFGPAWSLFWLTYSQPKRRRR